MSNTKPRVRVRCYTRGCKDTSPNYGPACDRCWNQLSGEEVNILKQAFNKNVDENSTFPRSTNFAGSMVAGTQCSSKMAPPRTAGVANAARKER